MMSLSSVSTCSPFPVNNKLIFLGFLAALSAVGNDKAINFENGLKISNLNQIQKDQITNYITDRLSGSANVSEEELINMALQIQTPASNLRVVEFSDVNNLNNFAFVNIDELLDDNEQTYYLQLVDWVKTIKNNSMEYVQKLISQPYLLYQRLKEAAILMTIAKTGYSICKFVCNTGLKIGQWTGNMFKGFYNMVKPALISYNQDKNSQTFSATLDNINNKITANNANETLDDILGETIEETVSYDVLEWLGIKHKDVVGEYTSSGLERAYSFCGPIGDTDGNSLAQLVPPVFKRTSSAPSRSMNRQSRLKSLEPYGHGGKTKRRAKRNPEKKGRRKTMNMNKNRQRTRKTTRSKNLRRAKK
jgi:hypothetical protein